LLNQRIDLTCWEKIAPTIGTLVRPKKTQVPYHFAFYSSSSLFPQYPIYYVKIRLGQCNLQTDWISINPPRLYYIVKLDLVPETEVSIFYKTSTAHFTFFHKKVNLWSNGLRSCRKKLFSLEHFNKHVLEDWL